MNCVVFMNANFQEFLGFLFFTVDKRNVFSVTDQVFDEFFLKS